MKWAMTIIMLTGTALAGSYSPSSKSVDERDKPQLEQDQVLMPEQKGIRQEEEELDVENGEDIILNESDDTIRHGKPNAKQGKLVPYGIK